MKFFAFFVLMMMVAVQAFALPAAPAPEDLESVHGNLPSGAAKAKRALFYYTYPTLKYYYPTPNYYYYPYDIIV